MTHEQTVHDIVCQLPRHIGCAEMEDTQQELFPNKSRKL